MHEDINELIDKNMGLVYKQLHRFNMIDDPDANSYAMEALYRAIKTYDANSGNKLSTYASVCIYNALGCYMRRMNRKKTIETISYNNLVDDDKEYSNFIPVDYSLEDNVMQRMRLEAAYEAMQRLRKTYQGNCSRIFELWYASEFSLNSVDIAKKLSVSQPYVSQTLARIRKDIKKEMGDE